MTATEPRRSPPATPPRLKIGDEIRVDGYYGPVDRFEPITEFVRVYRIDGIRLTPSYDDGSDGEVETTYPRGWEYQLAGWGWESESELISKGYGSS